MLLNSFCPLLSPPLELSKSILVLTVTTTLRRTLERNAGIYALIFPEPRLPKVFQSNCKTV
jgi:hypothetical protein